MGCGIVRPVTNPFKSIGFYKVLHEIGQVLIGMSIELILVAG